MINDIIIKKEKSRSLEIYYKIRINKKYNILKSIKYFAYILIHNEYTCIYI